MNIALFSSNDQKGGHVFLTGRQARHIIDVLKLKPGDSLSVGELNGLIGRGNILDINGSSVKLDVTLSQTPPPPSQVTLALALPRPQMLKRTLQTAACMGVKKILLLHSSKVEKSFWQSPQLKPENIQEHLLLGLEQAKDTLLPEVIFCKRFSELIDYLPDLPKPLAVIHPGRYPDYRSLPKDKPCTLLVGPEGGWSNTEIETISEQGHTYTMGQRILRVETAVTALLSHFL